MSGTIAPWVDGRVTVAMVGRCRPPLIGRLVVIPVDLVRTGLDVDGHAFPDPANA